MFGDSYVTPNFMVAPIDSFWGLAAKDINVDTIVNYATPGFGPDHVLHTLLNETSFDFANDYFILGIPPLARYLMFDDGDERSYDGTIIDTDFKTTKFTIRCLENTFCYRLAHESINPSTGRFDFDSKKSRTDHKSLIRYHNFEWVQIQALEKIFLLHQYLRSKDAKFMILNLSQPFLIQDLWPAGCEIIKKVKTLSECVVFETTYYSVNVDDNIKPADYSAGEGWSGHHGPEGNANYYHKVVKPKMIELGWIQDNA